MFSLFHKEIKTASFEDVKLCMNKKNQNMYLVNTLKDDQQNCLIYNTIPHTQEEMTINQMIETHNQNESMIILYGKNTNDLTVDKKYNQLKKLGFEKVHIYRGGIFEWLLLQDIYGFDEFQTTAKITDLLKYKPDNTIVKF